VSSSREAPELMTTAQAAAFLNLNENVLRRWARQGKIPAGKLGQKWCFSKRQLIEFVEAGGSRSSQHGASTPQAPSLTGGSSEGISGIMPRR